MNTVLCKTVSTKFINLHEQFVKVHKLFVNIIMCNKTHSDTHTIHNKRHSDTHTTNKTK